MSKFLIWDCGGIHVALAKALADQKHEVFYFVPPYAAYPKFVNAASGTGVPGITKVLDPGAYYDQVDCIVFPDVGAGDTAHWLRETGHTVFGAGLGEIMEMDRVKSIEIMDQFGIAHPETEVFDGIEKALEYIEANLGKSETNQLASGNLFVKINIWRGDIDSFPVESLEQAKDMFSKMRAEVGPYADVMPIIIQKKVEGIETGCDLFFNGTEFIKPYMVGCESGGSYVGFISDDLGFMQESMDKCAAYLKSVNYRGAFSMELFWDGKVASWIDWTCRFPMPLGLMYSTFIPDLGEFIIAIAKGEQPKSGLPMGKYIGAAEFNSENAINDWLGVEANEHTKLMRYLEINGQKHAVPGISTLGVVTGIGEDFNSLQKDLESNAEGVSAFFGSIQTDFLQGVMDKYVTPLKDLGVTDLFGPGATLSESRKPQSRAAKILEEWSNVYCP